jgi:hypothetical protein
VSKTSLKKYTRKHPHLKKWIKTNGDWFQNNPHLLKNMLENPEMLGAFNQALIKKRGKLYKRIQKLEKKQITASSSINRKRGFKFPKLQLPSLSSMNQRMTQTTEFIDGIRSLMGNMKP